MAGFPFVHRERVRFRDLDGFGHVNNAVYLTYLEEARNALLAHLGLARGVAEITMILARAEIDFRAQAGIGDELEIEVRPARLGTKSFDLEYEVRADGRVVAEARTVFVGRAPLAAPVSARAGLPACASATADPSLPGTRTPLPRNYDAGATIDIPDEWRRSLAA